MFYFFSFLVRHIPPAWNRCSWSCLCGFQSWELCCWANFSNVQVLRMEQEDQLWMWRQWNSFTSLARNRILHMKIGVAKLFIIEVFLRNSWIVLFIHVFGLTRSCSYILTWHWWYFGKVFLFSIKREILIEITPKSRWCLCLLAFHLEEVWIW